MLEVIDKPKSPETLRPGRTCFGADSSRPTQICLRSSRQDDDGLEITRKEKRESINRQRPALAAVKTC